MKALYLSVHGTTLSMHPNQICFRQLPRIVAHSMSQAPIRYAICPLIAIARTVSWPIQCRNFLHYRGKPSFETKHTQLLHFMDVLRSASFLPRFVFLCIKHPRFIHVTNVPEASACLVYEFLCGTRTLRVHGYVC